MQNVALAGRESSWVFLRGGLGPGPVNTSSLRCPDVLPYSRGRCLQGNSLSQEGSCCLAPATLFLKCFRVPSFYLNSGNCLKVDVVVVLIAHGTHLALRKVEIHVQGHTARTHVTRSPDCFIPGELGNGHQERMALGAQCPTDLGQPACSQ